MFAREAAKRGVRVVAIAVRGDTFWGLSRYVDKVFWLDVSGFSRIPQLLRSEGVTRAVMAGQINPRRLFDGQGRLGPELSRLLGRLEDNRADTIFKAIIRRLQEQGIEMVSSLTFLSHHLPQASTFSQKQPTEQQWQDIHFGLGLARKIAALDIGQTVVVKQKAIVAVEALEGTNATIYRGGRIGRCGVTVVKVSRPNQDFRFDVPVVGTGTVKILSRVRAACLAIEAGRTLVLDREEVVGLANKKGIVIVAV